MNTKKLIGAAAFSLALAGGGVAGALIGSPGSSGAQESTTSTTAPASGATGEHHVRFGRGPGLAAAATAIGISEDELRTELQAGKTIADVATAHGVDVDTVIDAMVTEVTANAREHITALVNGELPALGDHGRGHPGIRAEFSKVAEIIGITPAELKTALEDGQSIAQVAEAHDVDPQKVIDALVADATARIDAKVASGDLTAERAATMKENLTDRITNLVNHVGGFHGHRWPRP